MMLSSKFFVAFLFERSKPFSQTERKEIVVCDYVYIFFVYSVQYAHVKFDKFIMSQDPGDYSRLSEPYFKIQL